MYATDSESIAEPVVTLAHEIVEALRGQTILITGGRGYIGSALAQSLAAVDCKLILLDRSPKDSWIPQPQRADVSILQGNISERAIWPDLLSGVDRVFHLAENRYIHRGDQDPLYDLQVNALPVLYLLEACREFQFSPKIVFTSSANLFGTASQLPVNEDCRDQPLIPWAVHKLMAEGYLHAYARKYGIKSVILRLANVYGPTARPDVMTGVIVNKMVAQALAGEPLILYANQNCVRDYVFLEDVVQALLLASAQAELKDGQRFLIGSGQGRTVREVWQLIADQVGLHTGRNVSVQLDGSVSVEPFEMRNFVADTTRFKNATGWNPRVGLSLGIDLTIQALADMGLSAKSANRDNNVH